MDWVWQALAWTFPVVGAAFILLVLAAAAAVCWLWYAPAISSTLLCIGGAVISLVVIGGAALTIDWFGRLLGLVLITFIATVAILGLSWTVVVGWQKFGEKADVSVNVWYALPAVATAAIMVLVFARDLPAKLLENSLWLGHTVGHSIAGPEHYIAVAVSLPSVQTRERLINDRFEQVAWTDRLLKASMRQLPPAWSESGKQDHSEPSRDTSAKISPDVKSDKKDKSDDGASLSGSNSSERNLVQIGGEQAAWFERMLGVRDRIRLERADAMLDDRHDMDDDTLYNLTFSASVVPESNTHGYGVVEVLLTRQPDDLHPNGAGDDFELPGETGALDRFMALQRRDAFDIYIDWLARTQQLIRDDLKDTALELEDLTNPQIELANRLRRNWCESRLGLSITNIEAGTGNNASIEKQAAIKDACRLAVEEWLHLLPLEMASTARAAMWKEAATAMVAELQRLESNALRSLKMRNTKIYFESFHQRIPEFLEHINAMRELISERQCTIFGCPSSNQVQSPARFGLQYASMILDSAEKNPDDFLPEYDQSATTCGTLNRFAATLKIGTGPPHTPPFPKLAQVYKQLGIYLSEADPTRIGVDPEPSPPPPNQEGTQDTGPRKRITKPTNLQPFTLPCPSYITPPDSIRLLEALIRNVPDKSEIWDVADVDFAPQNSSEYLIRLTSSESGVQDRKFVTGRRCVSSINIGNLLLSGRPGLAPGRGTVHYDQFFEIDRQADAQGYCNLVAYPLVTSLVDQRNRWPRRTLKLGPTRNRDPAWPSRSEIPSDLSAGCKIDKYGPSQQVSVTEVEAFTDGQHNMPDSQGILRFVDGFRPVQIGRTYYPVIGVRQSPPTLELSQCIRPRDVIETKGEIYFGGEIEVLGRLAILLEGATFTGERPLPTTEAFPYGLTPRLTDEFKLESNETQSLNATLKQQGITTASRKSVSADLVSEQVVGFIPRQMQGLTGRSAEFGWIVTPQQDTSGSLSLALRDIPLGALIAVPSWWRTVLLRICAVGIGESNLPDLVQGIFWTLPKLQRNCRVETLRLPGTAADVPRRLGIEVMTTPYVRGPAFDPNKTSADALPSNEIEAGRPARILLRGGRLWRSTVVTLAGQRADQIAVLPNMQGIIAEFECVEAPETGPNEEGWRIAEILVWTSEGTTDPVSIKVRVPSGFTKCPDPSAVRGSRPGGHEIAEMPR